MVIESSAGLGWKGPYRSSSSKPPEWAGHLPPEVHGTCSMGRVQKAKWTCWRKWKAMQVALSNWEAEKQRAYMIFPYFTFQVTQLTRSLLFQKFGDFLCPCSLVSPASCWHSEWVKPICQARPCFFKLLFPLDEFAHKLKRKQKITLKKSGYVDFFLS